MHLLQVAKNDHTVPNQLTEELELPDFLDDNIMNCSGENSLIIDESGGCEQDYGDQQRLSAIELHPAADDFMEVSLFAFINTCTF